MMARTTPALLLGLVLTGCVQESQQLPFSTEDVKPTVKTVAATDSARLSTAAGAAVLFPAGSMTSSTQVSLSPVPAPAAAQQSGSVVSEGYRLEPAGLALEKPASAELKFSVPANSADAWLASVINVSGNEVKELGNTRVDVKSGLVETKISQLGTLSVVIPEASAVVLVERMGARASVQPSEPALLATGTDSLALRCGGRNDRCKGLALRATDNLLTQVRNAAALFPQINGTIRINGARATGKITLSTAVRVQLQSGASAENVAFNALVEPTASTVVTEDAAKITLTHVHFRISGSADTGEAVRDYHGTLVIPKNNARGLVSVSRAFQIRNKAGQLEDAEVTVTLPAAIYQ